jgi:Glyoxalase/Bleomycin resistance protein/Dioxygenase superfamily
VKKGILDTHVVTQVGLLVHDIEKASQIYADFLGVPKPRIQVTDALEKSQAKYRGNPTPARAKLAFFDVGPGLQLELIQPDEKPSTWREDLDRKGECVHHIAFRIKGMKEKVGDLAKEGMPLVQSGEYTGGRYAYVDATRDLKVLIELLEND